jgi:hypothetical protein
MLKALPKKQKTLGFSLGNRRKRLKLWQCLKLCQRNTPSFGKALSFAKEQGTLN